MRSSGNESACWNFCLKVKWFYVYSMSIEYNSNLFSEFHLDTQHYLFMSLGTILFLVDKLQILWLVLAAYSLWRSSYEDSNVFQNKSIKFNTEVKVVLILDQEYPSWKNGVKSLKEKTRIYTTTDSINYMRKLCVPYRLFLRRPWFNAGPFRSALISPQPTPIRAVNNAKTFKIRYSGFKTVNND